MFCRLAKSLKTGVFWSSCAVLSLALVADNVSTPAFLDTDVSSLHWSVIHARTVPLAWAYPAGADAVTLTIDNARGRRVLTRAFAAPVESCDWTVFDGDEVKEDDCFTLTLTFSDDSVETTRLALLRGSFGPTEVRAEDARWGVARNRQAVVPYGAAFLEGATDVPGLTVENRRTQTVVGELAGMSGWFGWSGRGGDTFDLALAAPGAASLAAEITFLASGSTLIVR